MRGIGYTFSRLPKAAAWLAGAALLAGTLSPRAHAQGDETAMAVPRLSPLGTDGVALPQPLALPDAAVLRHLFDDPRLPTRDLLRLGARLDPSVPLNDQIMGHVLAARYLADGRYATATTLSAWLARYAELPEAPALADLLHRRDPLAPLPAPIAGRRNPAADAPLDASDQAPRHLGAADTAAMRRAQAAQALFARNRDDAALRMATSAVRLCHGRVALASYVAGLAAWRLGRYHPALAHFTEAAGAPLTSPALHAAAAYWAARASVAAGRAARSPFWLRAASAEPATFYGQIAARMLDPADTQDVSYAVLGEADVAAVAAEPGGLRAFALLQLGQKARAAAELRLLATRQPDLTRAIVLVAEHAFLFDVAADLGSGLDAGTGTALHGDRFPVPRLSPRNGFLMDPALVYALTRVESNFDPHAVSGAGAQGLMQLMPRTAGAIARGRAHLRDPSVNLDLGQRYLTLLAADTPVGCDLIRLLAGYNDGPAKFAAWQGAVRDFHDPLLFIESIPVAQTRDFVQRTLTYTWLYAARLHLPTPSLDALAAGHYPMFCNPQPRVDLAALH